MPKLLSEPANERSSYPVRVEFREHLPDGTTPLVTPASVTWSLVNAAGGIVNARDAVVATAASAITIVLHGADLALAGTQDEERRLTVRATYDSETYGDGLELTEEFVFTVLSMAGVAT